MKVDLFLGSIPKIAIFKLFLISEVANCFIYYVNIIFIRCWCILAELMLKLWVVLLIFRIWEYPRISGSVLKLFQQISWSTMNCFYVIYLLSPLFIWGRWWSRNILPTLHDYLVTDNDISHISEAFPRRNDSFFESVKVIFQFSMCLFLFIKC